MTNELKFEGDLILRISQKICPILSMNKLPVDNKFSISVSPKKNNNKKQNVSDKLMWSRVRHEICFVSVSPCLLAAPCLFGKSFL